MCSNNNKIKCMCYVDYEQFQKPFKFGWKRELVYRNNVHNSKSANVFYITPDGKKLRSKRDIKLFIDDNLDINMFTFAKKPLGNDAEIIRIAAAKGWRTISEKPKGLIDLEKEDGCQFGDEVDQHFHTNEDLSILSEVVSDTYYECMVQKRSYDVHADLNHDQDNLDKLCTVNDYHYKHNYGNSPEMKTEDLSIMSELDSMTNEDCMIEEYSYDVTDLNHSKCDSDRLYSEDSDQEYYQADRTKYENGNIEDKHDALLREENQLQELQELLNEKEAAIEHMQIRLNGAESKIDNLQDILNEKEDVIEHMKICLNRTESEINNLQRQIHQNSSSSTKKISIEHIRHALPMLSTNQIALMTGSKKRVNWTSDEISDGFALSYFSRRGYTFLINKLKMPEPSIRTLQEWSENIIVAPGIQKHAFLVLKSLRSSLTEGESQVIISYDEMKCKSLYQYNKTLDLIMGPHRQMQTVMVRGLCAKFKQPINVAFDENVTPDLLNLLFTELYEIGYNVVGCVSDNGGGNVGLWGCCGVDFENSSIKHPVTGELIFMFSDVPHLIKLLRNWFIDGGFLLKDGTELNQALIRELLKTNTEISPIHKLSVHHLELDKTERQNVRLACELFSRSVAQCLRRTFPSNIIAGKLASFVELVNNWFDIMNSYSPNGIGFKRPYGVDLIEQNKVLDEMYSTIKSMKCYNKHKELQNTLQIFQKGINVDNIH